MESGARENRTILLVEDQALLALAKAQILQNRGFSVLTAGTGESAIRTCIETPSIDMVLMDIDLGYGIDGTEAARAILSSRDLPIVFLSNHSEQEIVERVKGITRYGYVLKSSGDFVLLEAIATAFELFEARKRADEQNERLLSLINATPDIICFKDGEGRWLEANEADIALFSLQDVDYRGKTDLELAEFVHPCYYDAFRTCHESDEVTWRAGRLSRGIETIVRYDGVVKRYDVIKVPTFEPDGTRKGLIVFGRDITDRTGPS